MNDAPPNFKPEAGKPESCEASGQVPGPKRRKDNTHRRNSAEAQGK